MLGEYMIVVSIRGKDTDSLNLTAKGHSKSEDVEGFPGNDLVKWHIKNSFKSVAFRISQSLDLFNHEVQQRDLTYFTGVHSTNQIISLFGQYFMALDWDYEKERLYGFESFKDKDVYIDVITAMPDNTKVMLYSQKKKRLYSLTRQKPKEKLDRVYESWVELKFSAN